MAGNVYNLPGIHRAVASLFYYLFPAFIKTPSPSPTRCTCGHVGVFEFCDRVLFAFSLRSVRVVVFDRNSRSSFVLPYLLIRNSSSANGKTRIRYVLPPYGPPQRRGLGRPLVLRKSAR